MSIKTSLLTTTIFVCLLAGVAVGSISITNLNRNIRLEAQRRVNHDLLIASAEYQRYVSEMADNIAGLHDSALALVEAGSSDGETTEIPWMKDRLGLTLLNICAPTGKALFGTHADQNVHVPVDRDPVLRRALLGNISFGTLLLSPERLNLEGGIALKKASAVFVGSQSELPVTTSALFVWAAVPIIDRSGRIVAILYGGRILNYNFEMVDGIQNLIFGNEMYNGKPLGTVTIFLDSIRVSTNVRGPDNSRALGTRVSAEVENTVLTRGERWNDRAFVVDAWYISAYQPIVDPDGGIIGMLYVGLLESPYKENERSIVLRVVWTALGLISLSVLLSLFLIGRITKPLRELGNVVFRMRDADWEYRIKRTSSFSEINKLNKAFVEMRGTIAARDKTLQEANKSLETKNGELHETNRNYMETLGFITHELKSPIAASQQMLSLVLDGTLDRDDEKRLDFLRRIDRALEQSQDMIKNYLDMTRVERGELAIRSSKFDLCTEVIDPVIEQNRGLFASKQIELTVACPGGLHMQGDPELLRIAITNFVNNAAKYGKEGGTARLTAELIDEVLRVSVWNEGDGFTPEERERLFQKYSRLTNSSSSGVRGSGLGLFICRYIAELHGGEVIADSELGNWARFTLLLPFTHQ